jgi:hypothetical protein
MNWRHILFVIGAFCGWMAYDIGAWTYSHTSWEAVKFVVGASVTLTYACCAIACLYALTFEPKKEVKK